MKSFLLAGIVGLGCVASAHADVLIVDRGLPTTNLNNVSGSDRSNVSWALGDPFFIGDDFTLGGATGTSYTITEIQTWVIGRYGVPTSATLYTGIGAQAALTATSSTPTFQQVNYANSSDYQTPSGSFRQIYEVDFTGLNIVATAGTTISFGVDGVNQGGYGFFNHASNAALSGSPQESANNSMSYYYHDGDGADFYSTFDSNGNGWDKSSDINVRVFAASPASVPEPASLALLSLGIAGVAAVRRRRAG